MTVKPNPTIQPVASLEGKTLTFRDAGVEDAGFILSLRTDEVKSRYLSPTNNDIEAQRNWLKQYRNGRGQAYFIIEFEALPVGTVRLYDAKGKSFCWGSWILMDTRPRHAAMESALMVYAYAVDYLGFEQSHFDVRKENERVWQFHERFGAQRISETDQDFLYNLSLDAIQQSRRRYHRFLSGGVIVHER